MIRKYLFFILLLIVSINANSQQKDFRSWYTVGVDAELFNLIDVSVVPEIRFWDNSSRFEGILAEADASVPLFKLLRFGLNYRYQADMEDPDEMRKTNRYGLYGEIYEKMGGFKLSYRALYQQEYTDMHSSEEGYLPLAQHRHKLSLRYKKKSLKLSPAVSAEMFFTLRPQWSAFEEKLRLSAGIQYEISKKLEAEIGYKYQQEFYESNPQTSRILCVGLTIDLK